VSVLKSPYAQDTGDADARRPAGVLRPWWLLAAAAAMLLPWAVYLAGNLPMDHLAVHWRITWVGFDVALAAVIAAAAAAARRDSPFLSELLVAAAVLLLCDAWFDVGTSAGTPDLAVAATEAVLAEIPLAAICLALAHRARRSASGAPSPRWR